MAKIQKAPMPQIPRNLRNYGISEPWADSAPPVANRVDMLKTPSPGFTLGSTFMPSAAPIPAHIVITSAEGKLLAVYLIQKAANNK